MTTAMVEVIPRNFVDVSDVVLGGITNPHTRRAYESDIAHFFDWWGSVGKPPMMKATINRYKNDCFDEGMGPSSINRKLSAIKKMVREAQDNGLIDPVLGQGIQNVEGIPVRGKSVANWLTKKEAQELLRLPDKDTVKGVRDRAILAVLLGCGLRREELVNLKWGDVQQRDGRWVAVVREGKRNKRRVVPMAPWTKVALDEWAGVIFDGQASTDEFIFLPLNKGGDIIGEQLSVNAVYAMVRQHTEELGFENIRPHDLRRTFAKLAYRGKADIIQISLSLGHDSVQTTQKYIGAEQDFYSAPCDVLGLEV
ncbi:tyrosine-type recombinase/integrase [bacterium]|nr:tyrosine-type recombinase/integrase [bacterium]